MLWSVCKGKYGKSEIPSQGKHLKGLLVLSAGKARILTGDMRADFKYSKCRQAEDELAFLN